MAEKNSETTTVLYLCTQTTERNGKWKRNPVLKLQYV